MPNKYKPFDVFAVTDSRERLRHHKRILYGEIGPPKKHLDIERQVAWLDIVVAVPAGTLQSSDRVWVELTTRFLSEVRAGGANKTTHKLLRQCLRKMWLTPADTVKAKDAMEAFNGKGLVN